MACGESLDSGLPGSSEGACRKYIDCNHCIREIVGCGLWDINLIPNGVAEASIHGHCLE